MAIVLGEHQYGKAEVRLVRVEREAERHMLTDLTVGVTLAGEFTGSYLAGDNSSILPTDSQKNTVYAFAKEQIDPCEEFGLRLARHFVESQPSVHRARATITRHRWQRLGRHSFERSGPEARTATVSCRGRDAWVVSGLTGLVLLNTTDSEFVGYVADPYTTLPEAKDRILASSVTARWRYAACRQAMGDVDWDESYAGVRQLLVAAFVDTYSRSVQQTLHAMGTRVLDRRPEVAEIRLSLTNQHHLPVDLEPFGLENADEVFVATDRPYGLIEAALARTGAPEPGLAWW